MNPVTKTFEAKILIVACGACLVIGSIAGGLASWKIQDWRFTADIATLTSEHKEKENKWEREKNAISIQAQQATAKALASTKAAQDAAAAADKAAQEKIYSAKIENDALRADVAAGNKRVRILTANLAASKHATSGDTSASSVGDAVQVDLSPEGERLVLDIRESTEQDDAVIKYLQNYITDVAKQCKR